MDAHKRKSGRFSTVVAFDFCLIAGITSEWNLAADLTEN